MTINQKLRVISNGLSKEATKIFFADLFSEKSLYKVDYVSTADYRTKLGKEIKTILNTYGKLIKEVIKSVTIIRSNKDLRDILTTNETYYFREKYLKNRNLIKEIKVYDDNGDGIIIFSNRKTLSPINKLEKRQFQIIKKYNS